MAIIEPIFLALYFGLGYLFAFLWEFVTAQILKIDHFACQKGYHFHHSCFGLICFVLSICFLGKENYAAAAKILIFGVGIIVQHTLTKDGFVFITKD